MVYLWIPILGLIVGFMALVWSADRFLSGAASTASNLGVSKMLIGLTVVSVGTSAPEILVAIAASLDGNPLLAVGNAIGSNIANIGLVLGVTAVIGELPFSQTVLRAELPWLGGATLLGIILLFDLELGFADGVMLLTGLGIILYLLIRNQSNAPTDIADAIREELEELPEMTTRQSIVRLLLGLVVLVISAELLVWAAIEIAAILGVSDMIIGLTVVAVGTSLPELAATVGAAMKGHTDIAIGNVVGSNILNILAVLAVPGLLAPTALDPVALWRDCGMMLAMTILLALFAYGINSRAVITRFEGAVMLSAWIGYNLLVIQQA
ncbi:MAG: calcium/sodium antiporter [Gammaproteobacteria bacterium]|nr:calcium/sodium antiporter [Gammaproteobacteria bacterium]